MEISLDYYYNNNTSGHGGMVDALDSDSSERIYKATTSCELDSNEIYNINRDNEAIKLEKNVYILLDNAINSTYFIKRLLLIALA